MGKRAVRYTLLGILLLASSLAGAGCSSQNGEMNGAVAVAMADPATLPADLAAEPQRVTEAYRFAAANAEILAQIPCYCGCGAMGHTSNYSCFWQADGGLELHATGCGICVDIAQDVLVGLSQGRSTQEIRAQIDADYSRFGPPTDTLPVGVQAIDWSNLPASRVNMTCDSTSASGEHRADSGNGQSTGGLVCTSP